jgi:CubicO group peptidase (beta-lactamase class C family)
MKRSRVFMAGIAMLVICQGTLVAQSTTKQDKSRIANYDKFLSEQFHADGPGCAALVASGGKILYKKAFGMANLELNVPMQPDMIFRIGSITKQFTAVTILQLEEKGKLSLQDEITKFIPDYPTHGNKITVEHLLTHTSGIRSYTEMKEWNDTVQRKDMSPEALISFFKDQPMDFVPGTRFKYNNSGYILLGYIIEKASGIPYDQYIRDNLFVPLGMHHTQFDTTAEIIKNRIPGYSKGTHGYENAGYLSMTQPYSAGSLVSTVEDLYTWNQGIRSGKIIKKENLEKAFIPYKLSDGTSTGYGYGWGIGEIQGSPSISHGGGINGFLTHAIYLPEEDVFVAVFSNCDALPPENTALKMAALTIGKLPVYKELRLDSLTLQKYVGVYENDKKEQRIISFKQGRLSSQRTGGMLYDIYPYEENKFFFNDGLACYEFMTDNSGKVTSLKFQRLGSESNSWIKTDKPLPRHREIEADPRILEKYVGVYELVPGFTLTVTLNGNKLMTQASGQDAFEVFAEGENKFFLKVVDAQIEFIPGDDGKITKLILYQNGTHEAKKIK